MSIRTARFGLARSLWAAFAAATAAGAPAATVFADDPSGDEVAEHAEAHEHTSTSDRNSAPTVDGNVTPLPLASAEPQGLEPEFEAEATRRAFPNVPLLTTGATVLTLSYVPTVIGAAFSDRDEGDLYIPVAGPWLEYRSGESETTGQKVLLAASGTVQGLGALAMLTSFFLPQRKTRSWYLLGNSDVRLTPSTMGTYGLVASGRF